MKRLLSLLGASAGGQIAVSGRSLFVSYALAGALDKAGYGAYSVIVPTLLFLMSLNASLVFEPMTFASARVGQKNEQVSAFVAYFSLVNGCVMLMVVVVGLLNGYPILKGAAALAYLAASVFLEFFRRCRLNQFEVKLVAVSDWVNLVLVVVIVSGCNMVYGVDLVSALLLLASVSVLQALYLMRGIHVIAVYCARDVIAVVGEYRRYIVKNFITFCASLGYVYVGPIAIYVLYGLETNANVEATRLLLAPLHLLNMAVAQMAFQYIGRALSAGNEIKDVVANVLWVVLALSMLTAVLVNGLYPFISEHLFGGRYAGYQQVMVVLSATYVVEGACMVVGFGLKAVSCFKAINLATAFAAIANVSILMAMASNGIVWILLAKCLASLVACLTMVFSIRRASLEFAH